MILDALLACVIAIIFARLITPSLSNIDRV